MKCDVRTMMEEWETEMECGVNNFNQFEEIVQKKEGDWNNAVAVLLWGVWMYMDVTKSEAREDLKINDDTPWVWMLSPYLKQSSKGEEWYGKKMTE